MASIVSAGTTSATALNMSADTTGILQLASNNGTVALTVNTSQNVGIGTSSPSHRLDVQSATGTMGVTSTTATNISYVFASNTGGSFLLGKDSSTGALTGTAYSNFLYNGSAYPTLFFTNGGERMRIDASGNTIFGSTGTVDSARVQIFGAKTLSSGIPQQQLNIADTSAIAAGVGGAIAFSAQYLSGSYTTMGSIEGVRENATVGHYGGNLVFRTRTNFGDNTERMRITSDGAVRIAMQDYASAPSSTNYGVSINNTGAGSRFFGQGSGTETQIEFGNTNGTRGSIQTNATVTLYNTTSDYRLKENVVPMANALATVLALKPCTYKWKVDGSDGQGFIAHELQAVVPDCVSGEKDAVDEEGNIKPQFVDTSFLVATLTAAIQELNAKVTALENK